MIKLTPRLRALGKLAMASVFVSCLLLAPEKGHAATNLRLLKTTTLYDSATTRSKSAGRLSPQTVTVLKQKGSWYQIKTSIGPKWVFVAPRPTVTKPDGTKTVNMKVKLRSRTAAYNAPVKSSRPVTYFSPQTVKAVGEYQEWFLISTSVGPKWIHKGTTDKSNAAVNKNQSVTMPSDMKKLNETVRLVSRTAAYNSPSKSAPIVSFFGVQSVKAIGVYHDWLLISTGIGPKWIHMETTSKWTKTSLGNTSVIAHGFGGIGGYRVLNTIDALHYNYGRGVRVFEVDLIMTSDNRLVARHDWNANHYAFLGQKHPAVAGPIPYSEVMSLKIHGKYKSTSFEDILAAMQKYPDIMIVTDTKLGDRASTEKAFSYLVKKTKAVNPALLSRIVPQIYNQPMLGYINKYHRFDHVIYTLYQESRNLSETNIINFSKKNGIDAVTYPDTRYKFYGADFAKKLNTEGLSSFVHTINDEKLAATFKKDGITGVYTDYLLFDGIKYVR
ncbi:glycerophosphodiester phosphodiesterase family protein [Peribacillus sp. SCS-155]|uniref:glycerophosphodiester phosphodiesterase family protein n=1 Tax=Peribacillus sedimenti TaxID=3115297 RepID=UPI003905E23F